MRQSRGLSHVYISMISHGVSLSTHPRVQPFPSLPHLLSLLLSHRLQIQKWRQEGNSQYTRDDQKVSRETRLRLKLHIIVPYRPPPLRRAPRTPPHILPLLRTFMGTRVEMRCVA